MDGLVDSSIASTGCRKFVTGSLYCFRYCLPDRVFDVGGAPISNKGRLLVS